jgi:hypothetical protein
MVVSLGYGGAVPRKVIPALAVSLAHCLVHRRGVDLQPGEEGRAEIEADLLIVVDYPGDASLMVKYPGGGIGGIALRSNPPIPVMIRMGLVLDLDGLQPRVLPWRLIKVPVNANASFHDRSAFPVEP